MSTKTSKRAGATEPIRFHAPKNVALFFVALLGAGLLCIAVWSLGRLSEAPLVELETIDAKVPDFELDPNTATWPELSQLPGIGETLGHRIVEYRDRHGPFATVEQMTEVKGIGPRLLEGLRSYVVIQSSQMPNEHLAEDMN